MSNFNKAKDRDNDGKAKPHYRFPYPCFTGKSVHYSEAKSGFHLRVNYGKNPSWWNRQRSTVPRRTDNRRKIHDILTGKDPDGIAWCPDKQPNQYYW